MKNISKIILLAWSALMLLSGALTWIQTMGVVQSTEFNLQIAILNKIGMVIIWLALYTICSTSNDKSQTDVKNT